MTSPGFDPARPYNDLPRLPPRPAPALPSGPLKSCTLRLTAQDYERLGILAVKTGKSRQQLLKDALNELLAARGRQLSCACLGTCEKDCCG